MPIDNLSLGEVIQAKVTSIRYVKKFATKEGDKYRFDISVEGRTSALEFLTQKVDMSDPANPKQNEFFPGVLQWIRCSRKNEYGENIEPYDPEELPAPQPTTSHVNATTKSVPRGTIDGERNCFNMNLQGASINFSTAYAKDLKIAEIARQPEGYRINEQDLEDIATWAVKINNSICRHLGQ